MFHFSIENKMDLKQKLVGLILLLILLVLYLVAIVGNNWLTYKGEHIGLWELCSKGSGCIVMAESPAYLSE